MHWRITKRGISSFRYSKSISRKGRKNLIRKGRRKIGMPSQVIAKKTLGPNSDTLR